jgi:Protein of unknown function (DUF3040)
MLSDAEERALLEIEMLLRAGDPGFARRFDARGRMPARHRLLVLELTAAAVALVVTAVAVPSLIGVVAGLEVLCVAIGVWVRHPAAHRGDIRGLTMLRRHLLAAVLASGAAIVVAIVVLLRLPHLGDWLQVHLGIVNEGGPYYGFWSGFGSDLAEISVLGAVGTAVYQLVKKFNCHQPGCWRVGNHPAAGGQFMLCYRHHPDYRGRPPGAELIERLHREHNERQALLHTRLDEIHERLHQRSDGVTGVPVGGQDGVQAGTEAPPGRTAGN